MLGIGIFEILIIAVVCLIAVGPKQMPMLIRKFAVFYRQFVLLRDELRFQLLSADTIIKEDKEPDHHPKSPKPTLISTEKSDG